MMRVLLALTALFMLEASSLVEASRTTLHAPRTTPFALSSTADDLPPLCAPTPQLQRAPECADLGPSAYAQEAAAAGLVFPLPVLEITATLPYRGLTPHAYGRVVTDTAPVYRHPLEALADLPPARRFEKGFVFVSLLGTVTVDGQEFFQINHGEYMRAADVKEARPSSFTGQFFSGLPGGKVGWLINTVQVSAGPGLPPAPDAPFVGRYQYVTPFNVQRAGEWDWYEVGPGQWVEQRNLALVTPTHPPGTPPDVIAVDTYEQSLGVYRGGNLIFATLASSGSRWFPTRPGTFQVWAKFTYGRMTGVYRDDRSDYYFLEDVPWILYYDGDRALHGAYWHDSFGVKTSHGCVNLSPRDARWLFNFANVGDTVVVFSSR